MSFWLPLLSKKSSNGPLPHPQMDLFENSFFVCALPDVTSILASQLCNKSTIDLAS